MNEFSQFDIKECETNFIGEKIKMNRILNKKISVHGFRIKPSKFEGDYSQIQIKVDNELRVVFTKSSKLKNQLQQIPENGFPFMATIVEENEAFKFT